MPYLLPAASYRVATAGKPARARNVSRLALLALALLMTLPATGAAAEACPWLNAATAGGFLGGPVTDVAVKRAKTGEDGNCDFFRRQGPLVYELRIETETLAARGGFAEYAARCHGAGAPLKAIGNEALACHDDAGAEGGLRELVVGRVRDRIFLVRISTNDGAAEQSVLREKARKVAEQVAGILF